jgi:hypothetical protein
MRMDRRATTLFLTVEESHLAFQESGPDRFVVQLGADGNGKADSILTAGALPEGLIGATLILDFEGCNPRLKHGDVIAVTGDFLPASEVSEGKEPA